MPLLITFVACALLAPVASASAASCFSQPSSCGYPDATNTGVPAGTSLASSGSVTLSAGQTLANKNVTGEVNVTGANVTIENSKIHTTGGGSGATAIILGNGATNFKLINSEVYGNGSKTNAPESGVWNHYNNSGAQVIGSYIHGSPDNWEGRVDLVKDSYMIVDAKYSGAHSENIYICGATAIVDHSTLYNESDETSLIFGDGICGKGNTVSVTNSMLAGGGYMLQPNAKGVSAPVTITGNRVGRCLTAAHQESWGGYECAEGADSYGYWPRGGHYGISADLGNNATWSGNVWDDNGQAVCASGAAGCGGSVEPPPPPADTAAAAVWTAPSGVIAGTPVTLNGSGSTGDAPLTCTWTRETQAGSVLDTKTGCQVSYTFPSSGTQYMRLSVTDVDGDSNSSLKTISVAEALPPPPPVDTAAGAVWTAPTGVTAGTPVTLNGSGSTGDAPLTCTWTRGDAGRLSARHEDGLPGQLHLPELRHPVRAAERHRRRRRLQLEPQDDLGRRGCGAHPCPRHRRRRGLDRPDRSDRGNARDPERQRLNRRRTAHLHLDPGDAVRLRPRHDDGLPDQLHVPELRHPVHAAERHRRRRRLQLEPQENLGRAARPRSNGIRQRSKSPRQRANRPRPPWRAIRSPRWPRRSRSQPYGARRARGRDR